MAVAHCFMYFVAFLPRIRTRERQGARTIDQQEVEYNIKYSIDNNNDTGRVRSNSQNSCTLRYCSLSFVQVLGVRFPLDFLRWSVLSIYFCL